MNDQQRHDLEQLTDLLNDEHADGEELDMLYLRLVGKDVAAIAREGYRQHGRDR